MSRTATSRNNARRTQKTKRDGVLTLIAVFKLVKVLLLLAVGFGALKLLDPHFSGRAQQWLAFLTSSVDRRLTQRLLARVSSVSAKQLEAVGVGAFAYAALYAVEGTGLWLGRRWAEYLTLIATASFVPFEIYELVRRFTVLRLSALVLNLAIVGYLIHRVRQRRRAKSR